jgi:hypothetical protein
MRVNSITHSSGEAKQHLKEPRAVYIWRRNCLQTFKGPTVRYANICVRAVEDFICFSHWGLIISYEHPSKPKSGHVVKLNRSWKEAGSSFELDVPELGGQKIHVGSLERYFPTRLVISDRLIYLGTTILTDGEIRECGQIVVASLEMEGGYHGLWRNCQHWVTFMAGVLCPNAKLPKRIDQVCGGILKMFKHNSKDEEKRISHIRELWKAKNC